MKRQSKDIDAQLADLRADYAKELEEHAAHLKQSISGINFSLPSLDLSFDVDFSEINSYFSSKQNLSKEILQKDRKLKNLSMIL
jgi:hypothetical protein